MFVMFFLSSIYHDKLLVAKLSRIGHSLAIRAEKEKPYSKRVIWHALFAINNEDLLPAISRPVCHPVAIWAEDRPIADVCVGPAFLTIYNNKLLTAFDGRVRRALAVRAKDYRTATYLIVGLALFTIRDNKPFVAGLDRKSTRLNSS